MTVFASSVGMQADQWGSRVGQQRPRASQRVANRIRRVHPHADLSRMTPDDPGPAIPHVEHR